jgi:hypothetical protein
MPMAAFQIKKSDSDCCVEYRIYSLEKPPRLRRSITGAGFFNASDIDLDGKRLTDGECMPVSNAIRHRGILPNPSRMALGVVLSRCSNSTVPDSSSTQYQLDRSPRSDPMVNFCSEIFLLGFTAAVLPFFIAGLLLSVP